MVVTAVDGVAANAEKVDTPMNATSAHAVNNAFMQDSWMGLRRPNVLSIRTWNPRVMTQPIPNRRVTSILPALMLESDKILDALPELATGFAHGRA